MALLFLEGFDKYGGTNTNSTSVQAMLQAGEWTSVPVTNVTIVAGLSATGQALSLQSNASLAAIKTFGANYSRLIGGIRFSTNLGGAVNNAAITFGDAGSPQCSITINTAGTISLRNGQASSTTVLATSSATVSANSTHYLEWDITFSNSAAYQVWLDGVSIFSGTGDTTTTANNSANQFILGGVAGGSQVVTYDDLYLFDSTGTTNNAVLLTSPRIESTFPTADSAVQFAVAAATLGATVARTATNFSTAANQFYVRPFTPARSCTLNSISVTVVTTSATINLRPIVYSDSAGAPGTLLSGGSTVTGITAGATATLTLTTPQSLTAGTQYWLGYMADIAVANAFITGDATAVGRTATSTFASGAPGTAPATTAGQTSVLLWGNVTSTGANYYSVSQSPPPAANTSYVTDTTVGHEDLYTFPNLSGIPATVYAVAVKAYCERSDSGARTVSLRMSSGGTDGGGSLTGQTPGTSYGWIGSHFPTDPNGSIPWTGTALNAATTGFKIDA